MSREIRAYLEVQFWEPVIGQILEQSQRAKKTPSEYTTYLSNLAVGARGLPQGVESGIGSKIYNILRNKVMHDLKNNILWPPWMTWTSDWV